MYFVCSGSCCPSDTILKFILFSFYFYIFLFLASFIPHRTSHTHDSFDEVMLNDEALIYSMNQQKSWIYSWRRKSFFAIYRRVAIYTHYTNGNREVYVLMSLLMYCRAGKIGSDGMMRCCRCYFKHELVRFVTKHPRNFHWREHSFYIFFCFCLKNSFRKNVERQRWLPTMVWCGTHTYTAQT